MTILTKQWQLAPALTAELQAGYQKQHLHPVIAQVLFNRGVSADQAAAFLVAQDFRHVNPYRLSGMSEAVYRLRRAIKRAEPIAVYGDFDADGVTATALMVSFLRVLKADVIPYIPHRVDEGYGLNTPALLKLADEGVKLVVTVDCGIRSVQEVAAAADYGLDVIITDHHSVSADGLIPDRAVAVVNPQKDDDPLLKGLSGVGVAFMLARALLVDALLRNGQSPQAQKRYTDLLESLLDLVAIGTVADIMPLNNVLNRALVKRGLARMNRAPRLGLAVLMDEAGLKPGTVNAGSISFVIGPRINAAGRLDSAMLACELLLETDATRARVLAQELSKLNDKRQRLTREAQARISQRIQEQGLAENTLIFVQDDEVQPGIVGLVAGRLVEEHYRPTVVVEHGEHESRASCRSIAQFHITRALDANADLLVRHGGHAMAAGFTVLNDNLPHLRQALLDYAQRELADVALQPILNIDAELSMRQLTMDLADELTILEPTGHANPPPTFVTRRLGIREARTVGQDSAHLRLKVSAQGEPPIDAIGFGLGHWLPQLPPLIDLAYQLEVNVYQDRRNLQLRILDLMPSS
ncbi:MAG: single-stranded-DNA-specific exonuclease RecJ [Anaerolineae bacterium]|nr:single-stranded-DNA-specific exonuclease RecJ [Anaerolineae bacterium]MDW8171465.1 single-stranded-DNA-specific exonuclease RecJ [Anaerolineae bacterium]